ncbi:MAG TPA: glycosyltransferase family 39 protein [Caulobacteraceae bacterium]|nr:glycosyltransferase family 39 protein [Caulobacteraceae bacterium]
MAKGEPKPQTIDARLVAVLVVALALAYAAASALATGPGAIHEDMAEAYVWGSHFEWGYYKHPPLWAWIGGGWFRFMPRTALSFALLCAANLALGLAGCWRLIGRFAGGDERPAAFLLLLVTPLYGFSAFVFNANSIFICLWPWTAWAFVRAMDEPGPASAALFGLFAGLDMMAKYYAVVLLLALAPALLAHPNGRRWLVSPWPYLATLVGAAVFAPHVAWLARTGFLPFHYFGGESGHAVGFSLAAAGRLFLGDLALLAPVILVVLIAGWRSLAALPGRARERWSDPRFRVLVVIELTPFLLTLVFGLIFRLKLSTNWTLGVFPLIPLVLLELAPPARRARLAWVTAALAITVAAVGIVAAPLTRATSTEAKDIEPRRQAVADAVALWRARTAAPLAVVGGSETYGDAAGFYAPSRPSVFIRFDPRISPWIDVSRLPQTGLLALCPANDAKCIAGARRYATSQTSWTPFDLPPLRRASSRTPSDYAYVVAVTPPLGQAITRP